MTSSVMPPSLDAGYVHICHYFRGVVSHLFISRKGNRAASGTTYAIHFPCQCFELSIPHSDSKDASSRSRTTSSVMPASLDAGYVHICHYFCGVVSQLFISRKGNRAASGTTYAIHFPCQGLNSQFLTVIARMCLLIRE